MDNNDTHAQIKVAVLNASNTMCEILSAVVEEVTLPLLDTCLATYCLLALIEALQSLQDTTGSDTACVMKMRKFSFICMRVQGHVVLELKCNGVCLGILSHCLQDINMHITLVRKACAAEGLMDLQSLFNSLLLTWVSLL